MRALTQKMWRDLWHVRAQALAIALVIASGVATFIMFVSTLDTLQVTREVYYREYRFAEVFSSLKRAPDSVRERIQAIAGVDQVETRVVAAANIDIPGFAEPVSGRIVSIPEGREPSLNRLYLREGRSVESGRRDEVVLSEAFAQAHGLTPGSTLTAIVNGKRRNLSVVGLALSPEYIHQLRPGGVFPDFQRYGVMWMGRETLGHAYDLDGAFNDVALSLTPGTRAGDVIDQLDGLLAPYGGLGAYARVDQSSHRFLSEEFRQLEQSLTIFPLIFFAVAAFLINVVITRLVTVQREQIATLKAFGYSNGAVVVHYSQLILAIVALGVVAGVAAGAWLGQGMSAIYMAFFRFPFLRFQLTPEMMGNALLASAVPAVLGTVFAVARAVALRPAEAMRPEAPGRYRVSWVERVGVQRWLSPSARMIVRHIGRRPVKAALSVLGIALACAITMTGRFQQDTVGFMVNVHFGLSQRDDVSVTFVEPTAYAARYELQSRPGVQQVEVFRLVPVRLRYEHRSYRTGIRGVERGGEIKRLLDADLRPIVLPEDGIVLTDYLGQMLGVKPGDRLTVEVLEGERPTRQVTVAALVKEYLGVGAYMHLPALNRLMREGPTISGAYLKVDAQERLGLYQWLKQTPRVASSLVRVQEIRNFDRVMKETMLFITYVATVFAVIIAFGVVYNSARIALAERSWELASLRVLGLTRAEISYILLGELALLTLVAIPLGLWFGRALCGFIAYQLQSDLYRVPVVLEPDTDAFAALVVLLSAVVSGLVVRRKLDKLDLVAVLKTRE